MTGCFAIPTDQNCQEENCIIAALIHALQWCQVSVDRNRDAESSLPEVIEWA